MDNTKCSLIILNYNGRDLLKKFMPSVLQAVEYDGRAHEVIVVDNDSTDGSQEYIRKYLPSTKLIAMPSNRYMDGYNEGIKASKYDIVVILNNDIEVEKYFLRPLLSHFNDNDIFAVKPTINVIEGESVKETRGAQIGAQFKLGFIEYLYREAKDEEELLFPHPTFCAPGGAGAFHRGKFLKLNGFDELFAPFYWEDVDLCYRAWKRGWKIIYDPRSVLYHYSHTTIGRLHKPRYVELIARRNRYLLVWKNITDWIYLLQHIGFIPFRLGWSLLQGNLSAFFSFFFALKQFNTALKKRRLEKKHATFSDREIFQLFDHLARDRTR